MSVTHPQVQPSHRSDATLRHRLDEVRPVRQVYRFGDFTFCDVPLKLTRNGAALDVRPQSLRILARLLASIGDLVSVDELGATMWPNDGDPSARVRVAVTHLRRALRDAEDQCIETIRGQGYRFVQPVAIEEQALLKSHTRAEASRSGS